MIIVTGASGKLGSAVLERLLDRVPADQVGVSVRNPAAVSHLAARGVRIRPGDFSDPASLAPAFDGADQVLVVSASTTGAEAVAQHVAAIDAAVRAGARRILYTSHQAVSPTSRFAPMVDHAATEEYLSRCGTPYLALRNGFYASTVPQLLGPALATGELAAPADGPVSWTTHADLAEAAAVHLTGPDWATGATEALTAGATLDLDEVAVRLSAITGRPLRRVVVDDGAWADGLVGHGVPALAAEMLLGMFHASRRGEFAVTDVALGELLGREPQSLDTVLHQLVTR